MMCPLKIFLLRVIFLVFYGALGIIFLCSLGPDFLGGWYGGALGLLVGIACIIATIITVERVR